MIQVPSAPKRPKTGDQKIAVAPSNSPNGSPLKYGVVLRSDIEDQKLQKTLCGEYVEHGSHLGRRVFLKSSLQPETGKQMDVFLYYYDSRDGIDYQGWWFGDEVGGTKVWAHCKEDSDLPPKSGWHVPYDGPVCEGFFVLDFEAYKQHRRDSASRQKHDEERRKRIDILKQKREAKIEDRKFEEAERVKALVDEATKRIEIAEVLVAQSKAAVLEVNQEFLEQEEVPEWLLDKADSEVKQATSQLCQAQVTTGAKLTALQREATEAEQKGKKNEASEKGAQELQKLQDRLAKAQHELKPLKSVREDCLQKMKGVKLKKELDRMISEVELKLDTFDAKGLDLQDKEIEDEAKAHLETAKEMVTEAKTMFGKRVDAEALFPEELPAFDKRVDAASKRVEEGDKTVKQVILKRTIESHVSAANDKLKEVADAFDKVEMAAHPVLNDQTLGLEVVLSTARSTEEAAVTTEANITTVKKFVATKMLEIKRVPANVVAESAASLQGIEKELDEFVKKFRDLKSRVGEAKRNANIAQARSAVENAETFAEAVVETAQVIADDALLMSLSAAEVTAAAVAIAKAEKQANAALVEAQKAVTARQMDTRGSNIPAEVRSELAAFQTRIGAAGVKVAKQKKLIDSVEQRKARQKIFKEAEDKLQAAEDIVAKAIAAAGALDAKASPPADAKEAPPVEKAEASGDGDGKSEDKVAENDENDQITEQAALLKIAEDTASEAHTAIKELDHFLGSQMTALGSSSVEVAKFSNRVKQALMRLCTSEKSVKTRSENIIVSSMILECKTREKEASDALQKANEAESKIGRGLERLPCHAVMKSVITLEGTTQEASTLVGNTKTFLAMKRIAVKKMSAAAMRKTTEAFADLQEHLDTSGKRLHELRISLPALKKEGMKLEASGFVATAEKLTDGAKQVTDALAKVTDQLSTEDMKIETEKVDKAQEDARKAIAGFLKLMEKRRKSMEPKQDGEEESAPTQDKDNVGAEFLECQKALEKSQAALEQQRASLTRSEHRFVARMLIAESRVHVDGLESKTKSTLDDAAQLFADPWKDFAASFALLELIKAFRVHMELRSDTPLKLFQALLGQDGSDDGVVTEARFVSFMKSVSEEKTGIPEYPEDQLNAIFSELVKTCGGTIVEDSFLRIFECRYRCMATITITDSLEIKAAKTIRKLDVDEVVAAQGELAKDEKIGLQRVYGLAEKDGVKGWVSVSGNQGKVFLQQCTPYDDCLRQVDRALKSLQEDIASTTRFLAEKASSLKPVRSGPLADAKAEIAKMQTQATQAAKQFKDIKNKIIDSKQKHSKHMAKERARHQQAADKRLAATVVSESTSLIEEAENETSSVFAKAEELLESKEEGHKKERVEIHQKLADGLQTIGKAAETIQAKLTSLKSSSAGPLAEAKGDVVKLKVRLGSIEVKCKRLHEALSASLG